MTRKALIVWGGWEGHQPGQCADIVAGWLREDGFDVRLADTPAAFGDPLLGEFSLVVPIYTMSSIDKDDAQNLASAIEGGVGMAGFHGGMGDAFRDCVEYQFIVGGQWVAHPGNIIDYRVDIVRPDDPITEGVSGFAHHSEQYYMHVDPSVEVLATTTFGGDHAWWIDGVVMPVAWKRRHGHGRVFYCSLGHQASELEIPQVETMMRRGMNWAAR